MSATAERHPNTLVGVVLDGAPCAFEWTDGAVGAWPAGVRLELASDDLSAVRASAEGMSLLSGVVLALVIQWTADDEAVRLAWLPSRDEGVRLVRAGSRVLVVLDTERLRAVRGRVVVELLVVPA